GVGGHAAHYCQQGTLRHVLAVVDRLAVTNAGEEFVVLGLVNVVLFPFVDPPPVVRVEGEAAAALGNVGPSRRSHGAGAHIVLTAAHLPRVAEQLGSVGVLIGHAVVIVNIAVLLAHAHLAAPHANCLGRISVHNPGRYV